MPIQIHTKTKLKRARDAQTKSHGALPENTLIMYDEFDLNEAIEKEIKERFEETKNVTDKMKVTLNKYIGQIPKDAHNELWNDLIEIIKINHRSK